jgi:cytochrome oxidase Cu insertion factor (SCO1/SenC/PrrC family)
MFGVDATLAARFPLAEENQMRTHRFVSPVAVVLALAVGGRAADPAPEEKTGPKVGARAPAFALKDQNGKERTLGEFLKKGKVALVFYRSASW